MSFITAIMPESRVEQDYDSRLQVLQGLNYQPTTAAVASGYIDEFLTDEGMSANILDFIKMRTDSTPEISKDDFMASPNYREDIDYFDGMTEGQLEMLSGRKLRQEQRAFRFDRATTSQSVLGFTAGIASAFVDPLNVVTAFIPVPGVSAKIATQVGKGAMGKTTGRLASGFAEGAVGTAYLEPVASFVSNQLQDDYTMADSLASIAFGGFIGSALHVGVGKVADIFDHGISPQTHTQAHQTAVGQILEGKVVDVDPIIEAGRFDNAGRILGKQEASLADGNFGAWRESDPFFLGNVEGSGSHAKYNNYSPVKLADRQWLEGLRYELENASGGARIFKEVDGQGSTPDVVAYEGDTPDWFKKYNAEATKNNALRKKLKKQADKGKVDAATVPGSQPILTRAKVAKTIDKLTKGEPLTKTEGDVANVVMAETRARREENVRQMLDVRTQREAHNRLDPEMAEYVSSQQESWFARQNSPESDSTYNADAAREADAVMAADDPFDPNGWQQEIAEYEAELNDMDAAGYLEPEEMAELEALREQELEAKNVGEAFRAASFCMTRNGA